MRLAVAVVVTTLLVGLSARGVAPQNAPAEQGGWNQEGAAKYLDDRMDAWFTGAKKLRTGQGETPCISCHTAVPYALSRPALRRAMHVTTPTPQEVRLLEGVIRRVETYDAHQPFYDFNEAKKTESRGTEAVINALVLASADAEQNRREPSEPTRRALRRLWETQRADGAWDWLDFGLEPFESVDATYFGATLAALAVGTSHAVLDYVVPYVKERHAFGEPIAHRQAVAFMCANIAIELDGLRLITWRGAARAEQGLPFIREAALAKRLGADKGMQIGLDGVQLLGGHGYTKEHPVERWYRDLRAIGVAEGVVVI